jgi:hypothetical protein
MAGLVGPASCARLPVRRDSGITRAGGECGHAQRSMTRLRAFMVDPWCMVVGCACQCGNMSIGKERIVNV